MKRGLLGHPLGHSYSKIIHEELIDKKYELFDFNEEESVKFLQKKEFDALNVTIPYKEFIIRYLDDLTNTAEKIKAVNSIKNINGQLIGHNTDYEGFKWLLKYNNVDLTDKKIAVLGSGGASKAVNLAIRDYMVKAIYNVSRSKKEGYITYEELKDKKIDVIINTTPVGMHPYVDEKIISIEDFKDISTVIDIIYNPFKTKLIIEAHSKGIKAVGGIEMLVAQAKSAIEFFDNIEISDEKVISVINKIKKLKQNIVLIGMPGSGKSTLANILSQKYNYKLIDTDDLIEQKINMSISEFFKKFSENEFRKIEKEIIKSLVNVNHGVISCGGGVIKDKENIDNLRHNGLIIMLERNIDNIVLDNKRPLSKNKDDLKKLYNERYLLYKKYSDIVIDNNGSIKDLLIKIEKELRL